MNIKIRARGKVFIFCVTLNKKVSTDIFGMACINRDNLKLLESQLETSIYQIFDAISGFIKGTYDKYHHDISLACFWEPRVYG